MSFQYINVWTNSNNRAGHHQLSLPDENVEEISVGEKHILIRTQSKVFGWGDNQKGQLGIDHGEQDAKQLIQVWPKLNNTRIVQVSCGWNHTLLLDDSGCVYSAGEGKNGALGYGRGTDSFSFKHVPNVKNAKFISAGKDHSLALSSLKVYGWGNSMDGQLGIPKEKICYQPQELYVYPSYFCYAGPKYSIFITQKGVYATGENQGGQLGFGNKMKIKMPKKINEMNEQIKWIGGSSNYSVLQTVNNNFYIAGTGCFGQYLYHTKIKHFRNCTQLLLSEDFGVLKNEQGTFSSWNQSSGSPPSQNKMFAQFAQASIFVGPKFLVCYSIETEEKCIVTKSQLVSNNQKQNKNMIGHQRNQRNDGVMARSSIQYSQQMISPHEQRHHSKSFNKKNRKQSENKFDLTENIDNSNVQLATKYEVDYAKGQKSYESSRRSRQYEQNSTRKYLREDAASPHFRNQFNDGMADIGCEIDNRISGFSCNDTQNLVLCQPSQRDQMKKKIQQNSIEGSILSYSEQTNQMATAITNKTINKGSDQKCWNKMQENGFSAFRFSTDGDMLDKIDYLEKQNKRKDQEILKMRKQLLEFIQIVQSDACLKRIAEQKGKQLLSKKKSELSAFDQQNGDVFTDNVRVLRGLLGKTIDSLTYSTN